MSKWWICVRGHRTGFARVVMISVISVAMLASRLVEAQEPPAAFGGVASPGPSVAPPPAALAYPPPPSGAPLPSPTATSPSPSSSPPLPSPLPSSWPPPPPAFPAAAPPPPAAAGAGGVLVELRTDNPNARIDMDVAGTTSTACFAPCRRVLARNQIYVIQGEGVRPTARFMLPDDRAAVTLDVHAGSSSRLMGGALLMGAGLVVSYVGAVVVQVAQNERNAADAFGTTHPDRANENMRTGVILMLAGVPAMLGGLYLVLTAHTSVISSTGASFTQDASPNPRRHPLVALTPRGLEF